MTDIEIADVPPMEEFARYIGRSIAGVPFVDVFDMAAALGYNTLVEGPTGAGKTSAIRAWCAVRQRRFYSVSSTNGVEPSQLFGRYIPNDGHDAAERPVIWQDGPVTELVRNGGVLLINEVNFLSQRVATALFSLLDFRREIQLPEHHGEVIRAHPDLAIFVDMNPGYAGTQELNLAFRNRFQIKIQWDYDAAVENSLVPVPPLLEMFETLRKRISEGSLEGVVGTNALIEFDRIASIDLPNGGHGYAFAVQNLANAFVDPVHRQTVLESFKVNSRIPNHYTMAASKRAAQRTGEVDPFNDFILGDVDSDLSSNDPIAEVNENELAFYDIEEEGD